MNEGTFFMAHGAGAGHSSEFLKQFSAAFCRIMKMHYAPVTLKYMSECEKTGKRRPPPNFSLLVKEYSDSVSSNREKTGDIVVAGKSMGGRLATQLSDNPSVSAVVCFGFPFHLQGKTEKNRLAFLENLKKPCLIFQGTRDAFGRPDWVNKQSLPSFVEIVWVEGANHDFELLKKQNKTREQVIEGMLNTLHQWLKKI